MARARTRRLRIRREFADAILDGRKTFEVRSKRHGIQVGDLLKFKVADSDGHPIEGRSYEVTYVLEGWHIEEGHAVYAIREHEDPVEVSRFVGAMARLASWATGGE